MSLILTLFENEPPRRYFGEIWNVFEEPVFLSIASFKL